MSDGKYGGQYDQHDGNCLVCGRMLNKKNECSLCDSIEAPLLNRIEALEAQVAELRALARTGDAESRQVIRESTYAINALAALLKEK